MKIDTKYFYFRLNEWHHLYTGLIIIGLSLLTANWIQIILWTLGWIIASDDLGQHIMQGVLGNPNYHTPFHYAGKPLYIFRKYITEKFKWLRWLNKL